MSTSTSGRRVGSPTEGIAISKHKRRYTSTTTVAALEHLSPSDTADVVAAATTAMAHHPSTFTAAVAANPSTTIIAQHPFTNTGVAVAPDTKDVNHHVLLEFDNLPSSLSRASHSTSNWQTSYALFSTPTTREKVVIEDTLMDNERGHLKRLHESSCQAC